jgi:hypothetical protein
MAQGGQVKSLSKPGMHWLSVLSYAFILHIRNPARQQKKKVSKFQGKPMPPLDITPLSTPKRETQDEKRDYNSS